MKRLPGLTWIVPVITIGGLVLLGSMGGANLSREFVIGQLKKSYGVSPERIDRWLAALPDGWEPSADSIARLRQPHDHPWPPSYSVANTGLALVFSHIGDGVIPNTGQFFQTTLVLANFSNQDAAGNVEFFNDQGAPLMLTIGGVTASEFPFQLAAGRTLKMTTSGTGAVKTGWAHVHADQPVSGNLIFGIRDQAGNVLTDVGVAESVLGTEFTIFADSIGESRTGLAVANPSDTETLNLQIDFNDPGGVMQATTPRQLLPRQHLALFADELFAGLANIQEREGTIVIRSLPNGGEAPVFGGITLRSTGSQLTSLPMVAPPTTDRTKLAFPHVADGLVGGLQIATAVVLFNNTGEAGTGLVEFFLSNGTPMILTIGEETDSAFDFQIDAGGVLRLVTEGTGEGKVGWARVTMDRPLSGSAIFQIFSTNGAAALNASSRPLALGSLVTEVGVNATPLYEAFRIVVDTTEVFDTGFAVVNPAEDGTPTQVRAELYSNNGNFLASKVQTVNALNHTAMFATQLFSDLPPALGDINEMEAYMVFSSDSPVAPLALRSAVAKLTSTPTLTEQHGFAPDSTLTLLQNLAGTSPPVQWTLHQNEDDLSLEKVRISIPQVGLDTSQVEVGQQLSVGYFPQEESSRMFSFFATGKGSVDFDFIMERPDGSHTLGTGKMEGSPNAGFTLTLELLGREPRTFVATDSDYHYFIFPGLLAIPPGTGGVNVETEFTSVSLLADQEQRIVRRTSQMLEFAAPEPGKAQLTSISPVLMAPGHVAQISGSNFGENPLVQFTGRDGAPAEGAVVDIVNGNLEVVLPDNLVSGPVTIDNGSGPGNPYQATVIFGPSFEIVPESRTGSTESGFKLLIKQTPGQLLMSRFLADVYFVDRALGGLATETIVGMATLKDPFATQFNLVVDTSADDMLKLWVATEQNNRLGSVTITRITEGTPGLRFLYVPLEEFEEAFFLGSDWQLELNFSGLPVQLPAANRIVAAVADLQSTPTGTGGAITSLHSTISAFFQTE